MEMPMTAYVKRPNRLRQEIRMGDKLIINGFDGETAWILNPLIGEPARAVVLGGPQAEQIRADSNFDGPLVDYKAQGYTVALDEPQLEGGKALVHLRVTSSKGQIRHLYLDPGTWLEVKYVSEMGTTRVEQQFGNYRTVDGVTSPFLIRQVVNGVTQSEIRVEKIEFNTPIDDALFRMPK
jgi:hypothetical protein